jgi:PKD repeat protein
MKKATSFLLPFALLGMLAVIVSSCKKEDPAPEPTVSIFSSVDGYQVAFTLTVTDATTFAWNFDDGETSTEQNPVHTYAQSGSYTASVTVTGPGGTATATDNITIAASKLEMLTGGPAMADGKTWVISTTIGEGDAIYKDHPDWVVDDPVVDGMLGLIGLPSEYEDEFTFKHDLTYTHDAKNDSVVSNTIYALLNQIPFRPSTEDAVVLTPFTPAAATFTFTEDTDLTLEMTSDEWPDSTASRTFSNVMVLEIAGGTEFVGVQDFTRKYVIHDISVDAMQIDMYMSGTDQSKLMYPSHMLRMKFVPKD